MAFQKILVALDFSSMAAETVFQQAIKLAKSEGSQLMLFHCISWENPEKVNPLVGIGTLGGVNLHSTLQQLCQETWTEKLEQVRYQLHTFYEEAESQGIQVEYEYKMGNPSTAICEQAEQWGADLVVVGRRTSIKWSELLLKSVSRYVSDHVSCSVFVIQTGISPIDHLPLSKVQPVFN